MYQPHITIMKAFFRPESLSNLAARRRGPKGPMFTPRCLASASPCWRFFHPIGIPKGHAIYLGPRGIQYNNSETWGYPVVVLYAYPRSHKDETWGWWLRQKAWIPHDYTGNFTQPWTIPILRSWGMASTCWKLPEGSSAFWAEPNVIS